MTPFPDSSRLIKEIRDLYEEDDEKAEAAIEAHLKETLGSFPLAKRVDVLQTLMAEFEGEGHRGLSQLDAATYKTIRDFLNFLLGNEAIKNGCSTDEVLQKLAQSLTLLFDKINHLIRIINCALLGKEEMSNEETIRHVIRFDMAGDRSSMTLDGYLGQIDQAFLVAINSFKAAIQTRMQVMLEELNPDQNLHQPKRAFRSKRGRKADLFDAYLNKYLNCNRYFESGRFMDDLLREFENNCERVLRK